MHKHKILVILINQTSGLWMILMLHKHKEDFFSECNHWGKKEIINCSIPISSTFCGVSLCYVTAGLKSDSGLGLLLLSSYQQ